MLIKQDFSNAIAKRAKEFIKFPETPEVLQSIRLFTNKSPFPQVVGAIDGCHITLKTVGEFTPGVYTKAQIGLK